MFYDPLKIALLGVAAWLVIWLVTPVYATGFISGGALAYIGACYLGLAAGIVQARALPSRAGRAEPVLERWALPFEYRTFLVTSALGLLGMALRVVDRVVLRGAGYGSDALQVREALEQSGVTPVGAMASIFFSFCFIPLMLVLASDRHAHRIKITIFAVLLFILPMAESLLQLSRSVLLVTLGMGFAVVVITRYRGSPLNRKLILTALLGVAALGLASASIFSVRLEGGGANLDDSTFTSVYADFLQPNLAARAALSSPDPIRSTIYRAGLPNGMYYISGLYEMSVLWERADGQPFAYGTLHFYPFVRAAQILLGGGRAPDFDYGQYLYRIGVWQTFFGPLWADFGWFGPVFMALFGRITQKLAIAVKRQKVADLPMYVYLLIVIIFMPVVNLLVNGLGMFCIVSFLLFRAYMRSRAPADGQGGGGGSWAMAADPNSGRM